MEDIEIQAEFEQILSVYESGTKANQDMVGC